MASVQARITGVEVALFWLCMIATGMSALLYPLHTLSFFVCIHLMYKFFYQMQQHLKIKKQLSSLGIKL